MNRRGFLRRSGMTTAAFGALALRVSPEAAGECAPRVAAPEMMRFTAGQTVCSLLIANGLARRTRASDWEIMGANLKAIESFWVDHKVDSVLAEPISVVAAADSTPAALNLKAVLCEVQAFHPGATSSQLHQAAGFLDRFPVSLKQQTLSNLQQHGFLPYIQQAQLSAERIAAEMRGFTASTTQTTHLHGGGPLRPKAMLSNASECMALAGVPLATLSMLPLPQGWRAVAGWSTAAAVAAGMAARSFAWEDTSVIA